ncbi:MAG: HAD family phosphatase [Pseudomonadota bacterium]
MPSTVVFDVGNVLIRWDPRLLFRKIFDDAAAMDSFLAEVTPPAWNVEQDRGRSWADAVAETVARHPEHEVAIRAWDTRWQEMVPGPIAGSVAILDALHRRAVPLYAITNFSAEKWAETRERFPFLKERFRDTVVSAHERLLKPDPAIYRCLLERNGLAAADCIFIDDSPKNVEGARAVGMEAVQFTGPEALAEALRGYGLPV